MGAKTAGFLIALVVMPLITVPSFGGNFGRGEDGYNPQHIESLPPEVREGVFRQCSTPKALHTFAHYTDNLQTVILHYEHLYCSTGDTLCRPSGCLHQVYGSSNGHYRLIRSYYAPEWE
jgi:hypothetical protein